MDELQMKLERAHERLAANEFAQAAALYEEVLEAQPNHPVALTHLGAIALRFQQAELAAELAGKAVEARPEYAEAHLNLGAALSMLGKPAEAVAALRQAMALKPELAQGHFNLAMDLGKLGRHAEAMESCRRCLEIWPDFAPAHNALAAALRQAGAAEAAMRHFGRAIECDPALAEAHYNLGVLHAGRKEMAEAIACYRRAVGLRPGFREALRNLAAALAGRKQWTEAAGTYRRLADVTPEAEVYFALAGALQKAGAAAGGRGVRIDGVEEACRQALLLNPGLQGAHTLLISLLIAEQRVAEAQGAIREALARHPDSAVVRFYAAALSGGDARGAPPEFVTALFDDYAATFDQHLVERLQYRGPQYLREAVASLGPRVFDVLDLGCGTGLCGMEFRGMARRMAGVDLSPAMIEASRRRGVYGELWQADIVAALREHRGEFDLLLGGDLFIYVGDLEPVFAAAADALPAGGWLAFTAEKMEGTGFQLRPTFRFAHSLYYLRETAARNRLREIYLKEEVLRIESGVPLMAWIVVLEKAD